MPEPRLDERAVEAVAAWVARAASDEQRWEPTSWEVACAREAVATYFAALDREDVARAFHDAYERLAPDYSYKTRDASAVPWEQVPENNRALMKATVAAALGLFTPDTEEPT
jgi:hypothetical protein